MKLLRPQTFSSVSQLCSAHRLILPRPHPWRLVQEPFLGAPRGLPTLRGFLIATNGILVAIDTEKDVFFGHITNFIPETEEGERKLDTLCGNTKEPKKDTALASALLAAYA